MVPRAYSAIGLLIAAALTAGCPRSKPLPDAALVSAARAHLAERERKIQTYRLSGRTADLASKQTLAFTFLYRGPDKMRAELLGPHGWIFDFDGKALRELSRADNQLIDFDLSGLPRGKADAALHEIFAPFAPEGFRAPLLPAGRDITAQLARDTAGKQVLHLRAQVTDGADHYAFAFRFSWPAMDLLDKEIDGPGGKVEIRVDHPFCDAPTGLCFPRALTELHGGTPSAFTVLDAIAINPPVPDGAFILDVPDGGTEVKKALTSR